MFRSIRRQLLAAGGAVMLLHGVLAAQTTQTPPRQPQAGQQQPQAGQQRPQAGQQQQPGQSAQPGQQPQRQPQAQQQQQPGAAGQASRTNGANQTDAQLAACLLIDNQNEVALGQFAEQRAKDEDVRKFAKMMVEHHGQIVAKLEPLAGTALQSRPQADAQQPGAAAQPQGNQQRQPGAAAQPQANQPRPGMARNQMRSNQLDFLSLKQELAAECLAAKKKELGEKSGPEFDACYLGSQVGSHQHAIVTLEVFKRHASANLQPILDEGLQITRSHLDEAKKLAKKAMDSAVSSTAKRESTEKRAE